MAYIFRTQTKPLDGPHVPYKSVYSEIYPRIFMMSCKWRFHKSFYLKTRWVDYNCFIEANNVLLFYAKKVKSVHWHRAVILKYKILEIPEHALSSSFFFTSYINPSCNIHFFLLTSVIIYTVFLWVLSFNLGKLIRTRFNNFLLFLISSTFHSI